MKFMKNKVWKYAVGLMLMFCCVGLLRTVEVRAAMQDEAEEYELMDTYSGHIEWHSWGGETRYWTFSIDKKSHVSVWYSSNKDDCELNIYNSSGGFVLKEADIQLGNQNAVTGWATASNYRILPADTYYISLYGSDADFQFRIQAEDLITFPRGQFSSLKSTKAGKVTVKAKAATDAIGYRIQYSMDVTFNTGVETIYSPTATKTISGLKKGKRYYFKICPYTVYDDGTYAFGQNSKVKSVVVKTN